MASQMDLKSATCSRRQSRGDPCRSTTTIHRWLHQPSRQQIRSRNHLRGRLHQQLTARQVLAVNADQITPYAADQMFCLKLSHALIFFLNILQSPHIAIMFLLVFSPYLLSKRFFEPPNSHVDARTPPETALSLAPPYTCYGLCALRYGWSAAALWSRLFRLHVHGLRARCYGLWASQGQRVQ